MKCSICLLDEKTLLGMCADGKWRCCWCCQHEGHLYDVTAGRCLKVQSRRSRTCYHCRAHTHTADRLKVRQKRAQSFLRGLQTVDRTGRGRRLMWLS